MIQLKNVSVIYPTIDFNSHSLQVQLYKLLWTNNRVPKREIIRPSLDNINLQIADGEKVGIIGLNGAGKSTLLKVISGILPPTVGIVKTEGRVNCLVDPTLGMDLNQTGLENIWNRLLFIGYSKAEILEVVDEIVEFSGISESINSPVRTYSSGMFLRLSFAISTQFFPDILILDEIIGTGDIEFRERASERINKFIENSRILVLSTHDLQAVQKFCNRVIFLKNGKVIYDGPVKTALEIYVSSTK